MNVFLSLVYNLLTNIKILSPASYELYMMTAPVPAWYPEFQKLGWFQIIQVHHTNINRGFEFFMT